MLCKLSDFMSKRFNLIIMSLLAVGSVFVLNSFTYSINHPTGNAIALQSGAMFSAIVLLFIGALFFHAKKI